MMYILDVLHTFCQMRSVTCATKDGNFLIGEAIMDAARAEIVRVDILW